MEQPFEIRTHVTLRSGGKKLFGILHLPLAAPGVKCPAVLFCNGFGGHKSGKFRLSVRQAERLSKAGIASFRFDYRGTGDSEGNFEDITIASQFEDTCRAKEYLQQHEAIDASKIGLIGRSFGGIIAIKVIGKALALWAPVFDARPWLEGAMHHKAIHIEAENGVSFAGQPLNKKFLQELAHLDVHANLIQAQACPLFVIQGKKDETLGTYHFEKYKEARSNAQAESQFLELEGSGHDFEVPEEQETLLKKTLDWFIKQLKN